MESLAILRIKRKRGAAHEALDGIVVESSHSNKRRATDTTRLGGDGSSFRREEVFRYAGTIERAALDDSSMDGLIQVI